VSAFLGACSSAGESTGPEASKEPTPTPTTLVVPTPTPEPTATAVPTAIPEPSATPTATPTPIPATATPTVEPTATSEPTGRDKVSFRFDIPADSDSIPTTYPGIRLEHSTFGDGNKEQQCQQPEQVRVEDGLLKITIEKKIVTCPNGDEREIASGMLRIDMVVLPGHSVEYRMKISSADLEIQSGIRAGLWFSSWTGAPFPAGGVFNCGDFNLNNSEVGFSTQYLDAAGNEPKIEINQPFNDEEFHTVRCDYGVNGNVSIHLDGKFIAEIARPITSSEYANPFDAPIDQAKFNASVGGDGNPVDLENFTTFEVSIDYIEVFVTPPVSGFTQSSFDLLNSIDQRVLARAGALGQFGFG